MSYSKTWTFLLNQQPSDRSTILQEQRSYVFQLITFLTANGWTADSSSNSSATSATTNIAALTDLVWANAGTAHSWIVLKSPVGIVAGLAGNYLGDQSRIWLVLDCLGTNAAILTTTFYPANKPATSGSITAAPTGTNGITQNAAAQSQFSRTTLGFPALFHFAITSQGNFWTGVTYTTTGNMVAFMSLLPTINPVQFLGKDYPYATFIYKTYVDSASNLVTGLVNVGKGGWNVDGTTLTSTQIEVAMLEVGGQVVGIGQTGGLNRVGVNETSPGIIYNMLAGGGSIAEIADFEFTGATLTNRLVDGNPVTKCAFTNWWLPANAEIQA